RSEHQQRGWMEDRRSRSQQDQHTQKASDRRDPASPRRALAQQRSREHHDEHRGEKEDGGSFGERKVAQPAEEANGRAEKHCRADELQRKQAGSPESAAASTPGEWRDDQHLPHVARPNDEKER